MSALKDFYTSLKITVWLLLIPLAALMLKGSLYSACGESCTISSRVLVCLFRTVGEKKAVVGKVMGKIASLHTYILISLLLRFLHVSAKPFN